MASYMYGDDSLGDFSDYIAKFDITSKKRRIAMKADIANLDPTSSTSAYGGYVKTGLALAAATAAVIVTAGAALPLVIGAGAAAAGAVGTTMTILGGAKRPSASPSGRPSVIDTQNSSQSSVSVDTTGTGDSSKKTSMLPILGIGAAVVAAFTLL